MTNWVFEAKNVDFIQLEKSYDKYGFIILKNVFDNRFIQELLDEADAICSGRAGDIIGSDIINKNIPDNKNSLLKKVIAIHFPHKVSELIRSTMHDPKIVEVLKSVIGPDVKCPQSMLFVKGTGKPGQAWHQDEQFIPTRDKSLCGVWIALDDARINNGGLWMHPTSHKPGILWQSKPHNDVRFDATDEAIGYPFEREGGIPVEIDAGDVAFFHGYTLHRSLNNSSKNSYRRSLVYHYMSARSILPWSIENPPVPRADFRDFELVSGEDPYAWKGMKNLSIPYLRPENEEEAKLVFSQLAKSCQ